MCMCKKSILAISGIVALSVSGYIIYKNKDDIMKELKKLQKTANKTKKIC